MLKKFLYIFLVFSFFLYSQKIWAASGDDPRTQAQLLAHHRGRFVDLAALEAIVGGDPNVPLTTRLQAMRDALGGTTLTAGVSDIRDALGGSGSVLDRVATIQGAVSGPS